MDQPGSLDSKNRIIRSGKPCLLLLLCLFSLPLAAQPVSVSGFDLLVNGLDCSDWAYHDGDGFACYSGPNLRSGGYIGSWTRPGAPPDLGSPLPALLSLQGQTLPPGQYRVFLRVEMLGTGGEANMTLGGATSATAVAFDNFDGDGKWTDMGVLTTTQDATDVLLELINTNLSSGLQFIVAAVYITANLNEIVDKNARVLTLDPNQPMNIGPHRPGNVLENSSFELALGHGWGEAQSPDHLFAVVDSAEFVHGQRSMRIKKNPSAIHSFYSKTYALRENRTHSFSAAMKAEPGKTASVLMLVKNAYQADSFTHYPTPLDGRHQIVVTVTDQWQTFSMSPDLLALPTGHYRVAFSLLAGDSDVWIDAVQLEEGPAVTAYAPVNSVEVALESGKPAHVFCDSPLLPGDPFCDGAPAHLSAVFSNTSGATVPGVVARYEVYNLFNERVNSGQLTLDVAPGISQVPLPGTAPGERGVFRGVVWLEGMSASEDELVFALVPPPRLTGAEASMIGTHNELKTDVHVDAISRLGTNWTRTWDYDPLLRWDRIQAVEGVFVWNDTAIDRALANNVRVLGTLGADSMGNVPAYAKDGTGFPDLAKWDDYVRAVVTHFKDKIKYWEIWNEPNHYFKDATAKQRYVDMLGVAATAIRQIDPTATIIGIGGSANEAWVQDILNLIEPLPPTDPGYQGLWQNSMDALSTHIYPDLYGSSYVDANNFLDQFINAYGIPVWNTETGVWVASFYQSGKSNYFAPGSYLNPVDSGEPFYRNLRGVEMMTTNLLASLGVGMERYFYYGTPSRHIYHAPTVVHPTMIEFDDSIRPTGIAYAVAAQFIDGRQGQGEITVAASPTDNVYAYLFDAQPSGSDTPVVAIWAGRERGGLSLARHAGDWTPLSLQHADLVPANVDIYDVMGNPVTPDANGKFNLSRYPLYILGSNLSAAALANAVSNGAYAVETDQQVPGLAIIVAPRGKSFAEQLTLRWIAMDTMARPMLPFPEDLLYRYRLEGYESTWSAWSPAVEVSYPSLPAGNYILHVEVKDAAGNVSTLSSETLYYRGPDWPDVTPDGDINGDGSVNAADVLLALRHVLGLVTLDAAQQARGDLYPAGFGDGAIDLSDLLRIKQTAL